MSEAAGRIAAELVQLVAGAVEHPVVAAGVGPPDALGVGEDRAGAIDPRRTHNRRDQAASSSRRHESSAAETRTSVAAVLGSWRDDVSAAGGIARRLERRVAGCRRSQRTADVLGLEFMCAEDSLDRQPGGLFVFCGDR